MLFDMTSLSQKVLRIISVGVVLYLREIISYQNFDNIIRFVGSEISNFFGNRKMLPSLMYWEVNIEMIILIPSTIKRARNPITLQFFWLTVRQTLSFFPIGFSLCSLSYDVKLALIFVRKFRVFCSFLGNYLIWDH